MRNSSTYFIDGPNSLYTFAYAHKMPLGIRTICVYGRVDFPLHSRTIWAALYSNKSQIIILGPLIVVRFGQSIESILIYCMFYLPILIVCFNP